MKKICNKCKKTYNTDSNFCVKCGTKLIECNEEINRNSKKEANNILITTSGLNVEYEIIDSIFALDSSTAGIFFGADPNIAFKKVKEQLRKKCEQLGGDAVINCQFEYRVALNNGLLGSKQVIEIFAYGTAVRLQ